MFFKNFNKTLEESVEEKTQFFFKNSSQANLL